MEAISSPSIGLLDTRYLTLDQSTPQTLTDSPIFTGFTNGSIPYFSGGQLVQENSELNYNSGTNTLHADYLDTTALTISGWTEGQIAFQGASYLTQDADLTYNTTTDMLHATNIDATTFTTANLTFNTNVITSDTGLVSFNDDTISTVGDITNGTITLSGGAITGVTTMAMSSTLTISVPTTTSEALILKTTDDNATKNLLEIQSSTGGVLSRISPVGEVLLTAKAATNKPLTVKAASSQTANLTEWQNSSGGVLGAITSGGRYYSTVKSSAGQTNGLSVEQFLDTTNVTNPRGVQIIATLTDRAQNGTGTGAINTLYSLVQNASNQSVAETNGMYLQYLKNDSGTETRHNGIRIGTPSVTGGTLTNNYGIYLDNQSGATNNYAIYTGAGLNQLGDQLKIDLVADKIGLIVQAHSSQTANLTNWTDSSNNVLLSVQADGDLEFADGTDIVLNTTTGTKIGTATNQKLGFFNATPIVQPTEITDELTTITHTAPGTPDYAVQDLVDSGVVSAFGFATKDEGNTVLSVIANLQARVNELENVLSSLGLLADAD